MADPFDYSRFSLADLVDARNHIDRTAYPERAAEIDRWIRQRTAERDTARTAPPPPLAYSLPVTPRPPRAMSVMAGCGVAAAVAVAALISLFIVLVLRGRMQGEGAQKAATQVVLAFTENWTPEPLMRQASKDLREKVTAEEAARLFEIYKRLGTRTSLGEPTGTTTASSGFGTFASGIRAEFAFPATFTTGPATIRIRMIREDNAWKVDGFWIESKALLGST